MTYLSTYMSRGDGLKRTLEVTRYAKSPPLGPLPQAKVLITPLIQPQTSNFQLAPAHPSQMNDMEREDTNSNEP